MNRLLSVCIALLMVCSLAACGDSGSKQTAEPGGTPVTNAPEESANSGAGDKTIVIGEALDSTDDNTQSGKDMRQRLAEEYYNETGVKVEFVYTDAQSSVDTQISDVDSLIVQDVDAISIRVVDEFGSVPCFQAAKSAGIPVCATWWGCGDESAYDAIIWAVDNYTIGVVQAQWLIEQAKANSDQTYYVGYIDGLAAVSDTLQRYIGFCDTIEAEYGSLDSGAIQVVVSGYGENSADTSLQLVEDWMTRYPELNTIVAFNDSCAYAAVQVFNGLGVAMDDVVIIGCDATTYLQSVKDGEIDMSMYIDINIAVKQEFDVMVALALGESVEGMCDPDPDVCVRVSTETFESFEAGYPEIVSEYCS